MKLATVEIFHVHGTPSERAAKTGPYFLVKVTSPDGACGWGQAVHRGGDLTVPAIATLARWLIELDKFTIEGAWHHLARKGLGRGASGVQIHALAALDVALHDLLGHELGVPVSTLLGGRLRDTVPVYASFMGPPLSLDIELERVTRTVERGFTAVKLHAGAHGAAGDSASTAVEVAEAIRARWPSRRELQFIVDVNNTFTVHEAIRVGRRLEDLDVWWMEEPVAAHDLLGAHRVADALDLPISAGEADSNASQFRDLILTAGVDILQPNVTTAGGFTGAKKIAALAEAFNRPISCHNTDPTVMTAANMHFASWAKMAILPQEYLSLDDSHPMRDETPILAKALLPDNSGLVTLTDDPGLGIVVDEERLRAISSVISV
jgi:L-alanine-DL-glutamate epimerase-like enolase superfamily enzyme